MSMEKHVQHPKNFANNIHFIQKSVSLALVNPGRLIRVRANNRFKQVYLATQYKTRDDVNVGQQESL